jgi:hypothetical protein
MAQGTAEAEDVLAFELDDQAGPPRAADASLH